MKQNLTSGSAVTLASNQFGPLQVLVDSSNVYWLTWDNKIYKVSIDGGTRTEVTSGGGRGLNWMAVDDTSIYWTDTSKVMKRTPK
jgi:hypothetical protein